MKAREIKNNLMKNSPLDEPANSNALPSSGRPLGPGSFSANSSMCLLDSFQYAYHRTKVGNNR